HTSSTAPSTSAISTLSLHDALPIFGHDVVRNADAVRHVIGYMPDFFGVYKDMEVTEYLDFFGACYKIPTAQREKTRYSVTSMSLDRKSTRLNSSHVSISYAVFCLKK